MVHPYYKNIDILDPTSKINEKKDLFNLYKGNNSDLTKAYFSNLTKAAKTTHQEAEKKARQEVEKYKPELKKFGDLFSMLPRFSMKRKIAFICICNKTGIG